MLRPVATPDRVDVPRRNPGLIVSASALCAAVALLWISWHLRRQTNWMDLQIYRNSIEYWMHGHGLYDFQQPGTRSHLGFTYPPFGAVVLAPLALVSQHQAELLFTGLNLLLCAACGSGFAVALARQFSWPRWPSAVLGTAMVLSLEPIRESLGFGQINIVLLALVAGDMWLLSTGRRGGVAIGLAAAIKLTPAVLILALFAARRGDAGRRALGACAGATGVAALLLPESSWQYWTREVWQTSRVGKPNRITNQSWTGVIARMADTTTPSRLLGLLGAVGAVVVALLLARRARGSWAVPRVLTIAAAAATMASPISWTHHYWWAVPAVAALLYRAVETRSPTVIALLLVVYAMFVVGPIRLEQAVHHHPLASAAAGGLYLYATILTCIGLFAARRSAVRIGDVVGGWYQSLRGHDGGEHQDAADQAGPGQPVGKPLAGQRRARWAEPVRNLEGPG